jgi:hypothetical protein
VTLYQNGTNECRNERVPKVTDLPPTLGGRRADSGIENTGISATPGQRQKGTVMVSQQSNLFNPDQYGGFELSSRAHRGDPTTSHEAAAKIAKSEKAALHRKSLDIFISVACRTLCSWWTEYACQLPPGDELNSPCCLSPCSEKGCVSLLPPFHRCPTKNPATNIGRP